MNKIEQLRKSALASCNNRGHVMGNFKNVPNGIGGKIKYAHCKVCDKQVVIMEQPAPNDIDIGGEAVALDCND